MPTRNGAFEKVTRERVDNLAQEVKSGFKSVTDRLVKIESGQQELFNHQSNRLPMWATVTITLLTSIVVGLAVAFLKGG